jgi:hypothetical protein
MPSFLTYVEYEKHIKTQQKKILKGNMVFTRPNVKGKVSGDEYFYQRHINYFCERVESFVCLLLISTKFLTDSIKKKFWAGENVAVNP